MRTLLVLLFGLAVALASAGCEENRDPQTPDGAMHLLRDALMAEDIAGLLDASSARTVTLRVTASHVPASSPIISVCARCA